PMAVFFPRLISATRVAFSVIQITLSRFRSPSCGFTSGSVNPINFVLRQFFRRFTSQEHFCSPAFLRVLAEERGLGYLWRRFCSSFRTLLSRWGARLRAMLTSH